MEVVSSELKDFDVWIALVKEVEHLFGPIYGLKTQIVLPPPIEEHSREGFKWKITD